MDSPNGMYFGVLVVGLISVSIARFEPRGLVFYSQIKDFSVQVC